MSGFWDNEIDYIEKWILNRDSFSVGILVEVIQRKFNHYSNYGTIQKHLNNQIIKPLLEMGKIEKIKNGQYCRCVGR